MFFSGWAPLVPLHDWDIAPVGHSVECSPYLGGRRASRQAPSRVPISPSELAASTHSPLVTQDYLGQGVSQLTFLAPSVDVAEGLLGHAGGTLPTRSGLSRAAEVFAATHQRFHVKSHAPLPQHCGLVYVECQVTAIGPTANLHNKSNNNNNNSSTGRAASALPLVLGVCAASLPSHILPGEAEDSIGFLTGSRVVYEHGRSEPERLTYTLSPSPPLTASGARCDGLGEEDELLAQTVSAPASPGPPRRGLEVGDAVGCLVDCERSTVRFTVNGQILDGYVGRLRSAKDSGSRATTTTTTRSRPVQLSGATAPAGSSSPLFFFAIGMTQRTPSVAVRVVLQVGLNAQSRIPIHVPLRTAGSEQPVTPSDAHNHPHAIVNAFAHLVFPFRSFVQRDGMQQVHAREQGQVRGDTRDAVSAGEDKADALGDQALCEDAVVTLLRQHLAMRGMHRALAALDAEAKALRLVQTPDTRINSEHQSVKAEEAGEGSGSSTHGRDAKQGGASPCALTFVAYMAAVRDRLLGGSRQEPAQIATLAASTSSLLALFLSHSPLSEAVEWRVAQCVITTPSTLDTASPQQPRSPRELGCRLRLSPAAARELGLYLLAQHIDLYFLLRVLPLIESVVHDLRHRLHTLTQPAALSPPGDGVSTTAVWHVFTHAVLQPVEALAGLPDRAARVPPPPIEAASPLRGTRRHREDAGVSLRRALERCSDSVTCPAEHTTTASSTTGELDEVMRLLMEEALSPRSPHRKTLARGEERQTDAPHILPHHAEPTDPISTHVAVGNALVALVQAVEATCVVLTSQSSSSRAAAEANTVRAQRIRHFTTAADRLLEAGLAQVRWRAWQRLSHVMEAVNARALRILVRWQVSFITQHKEGTAVTATAATTVLLPLDHPDARGADISCALKALDDGEAPTSRAIPPVVASALHTPHSADSEEEEEVEELYRLDALAEDTIDPFFFTPTLRDEEAERETHGVPLPLPDQASSSSVSSRLAEDVFAQRDWTGEEQEPVEELMEVEEEGEEEEEEESVHSHTASDISARGTPCRRARGGDPRKTIGSSSSSARVVWKGMQCSSPRRYFYVSSSPVSRQRGKDALAWSALSLRSIWRRVQLVAALRPEQHASTSVFLARGELAEKRLCADEHAHGTEACAEEENADVFGGIEARCLQQIETRLHSLYVFL